MGKGREKEMGGEGRWKGCRVPPPLQSFDH